MPDVRCRIGEVVVFAPSDRGGLLQPLDPPQEAYILDNHARKRLLYFLDVALKDLDAGL